MSPSKLSISDSLALPNSSVRMPQLGFGIWQVGTDKAVQACLWALEAGYRHIDSAQLYRNEAQMGEAVKQSKLDRSQVFLTTKIGFPAATQEETYAKMLESVCKIAGDYGYVDLFLIHTPRGGADARKTLWLALEQLLAKGKTKSIGVSNFDVEQIEEMKAYAKIWPPHVNQIELNPWNQQREVDAYCKKQGIVVQAYSPLSSGEHLGDPVLADVAKKYAKSPAQVLIRYALQKGWAPLPKSENEARIKANTDVYDFEISGEDMVTLDALDKQ